MEIHPLLDDVILYWRVQRGKVLSQCHPAKRSDYEAWLAGHLQNGGRITHHHDRPWNDWIWMRPIADTLELAPVYNEQAFHIIIPAGCQVSGDGGHLALFYMNGFKPPTGMAAGVPSFSDLKIE